MTEASGTRLPVLALGRDIFRVYADHWWLLVPLALVVLLPQAVADAVFADVEIEHVRNFGDAAKVASIPLAVAINLGGEALYAGIVAAAVLHWRAGEHVRDLGAIARSIPYRRLIALDFLIAVGFAIGFAILLVPGLILYTYLAISPALVKLQGLSIREALTKSAKLVRGNFWRAVIFTTAVVLATDSLATVLESPLHGISGELAFNFAIHAALEPFQGLATVLLAIALLELHGEVAHG